MQVAQHIRVMKKCFFSIFTKTSSQILAKSFSGSRGCTYTHNTDCVSSHRATSHRIAAYTTTKRYNRFTPTDHAAIKDSRNSTVWKTTTTARDEQTFV